MGEWTTMFSSNPDLGVMEQAYNKLKSQSAQHPCCCKMSSRMLTPDTDPNLQPPQAPTKRQITDIDRQKEEEELQMALKLSIQDKSPAGLSGQKSSAAELSGTSTATESQPAVSQPVPSGTTAATVSRVRALFDFQPSEP